MPAFHSPDWPWLAIVGLGVFHGLNPGMGWLLAVSNGMQAGRTRAVFGALVPLSAGHLLAILVVLLPVSLLSAYVHHLWGVRLAAAMVLVGMGLYKLVNRRHPRMLARIGPRHLVLWSFLMATAHGAGLMLVPFYLHLPIGGGHVSGVLASAAAGSLFLAFTASLLHTAAMMASAGVIAWVVYRYAGLRMLRRAWINMDLLWAVLLMVTGGFALLL